VHLLSVEVCPSCKRGASLIAGIFVATMLTALPNGTTHARSPGGEPRGVHSERRSPKRGPDAERRRDGDRWPDAFPGAGGDRPAGPRTGNAPPDASASAPSGALLEPPQRAAWSSAASDSSAADEESDSMWEDEEALDGDARRGEPRSTRRLSRSSARRSAYRESLLQYRESRRALMLSASRMLAVTDKAGRPAERAEDAERTDEGQPAREAGARFADPDDEWMNESPQKPRPPKPLSRDGTETPTAALSATPVASRSGAEEKSASAAASTTPPKAGAPRSVGGTLYSLQVILGLRAPPDFATSRLETPRVRAAAQPGVSSLWEQLQSEVLANSQDSVQELKWERISNFVRVPFWIEQTILVGCLICLNAFLHTFTILPLRFLVAWWRWAYNAGEWLLSGRKHYLSASQKCDILKGLLVVQTCMIMARLADASKMYHSVRGQDFVKLSVIFSVLEIADRLCCSFGQDVLDSLFSRSTLARHSDGTQSYARIAAYYALSLAYMVAHSFVLLYELVTLNVAINSYDNALLTLLLSNQFFEIKTSVFKRFEKENLFQLTCADIVERFQMCVVLGVIGVRNLIEVSGGGGLSSQSGSFGPLPTSFVAYPYLNLVARTLNPVLTVLLSELLVDWLKHAFVTKFNHIRPALYGRYIDVLCYDLLPASARAASSDGTTRREFTLVDQSPRVSRRVGLAVLPLACVLVRLSVQIAGMLLDSAPLEDEFEAPVPVDTHRRGAALLRLGGWALLLAVGWTSLVMLKVLLGVRLCAYALRRHASQHEREEEERVNARGREPIGETQAEVAMRNQLRTAVDRAEHDAGVVDLYGQRPAANQKARKDMNLLDVGRYTLAGNRLW